MRKCDKCGLVLIDEKGDIRNHPNTMDSSGKIFLCNDCSDYCKIRMVRYGIPIEEVLKKDKSDQAEPKKKEVEPKEEPKAEKKVPVKKVVKKKGNK